MTSKPDDIPQDVRDAAEAAKDNAGPDDGWTVIITRIVLAEREAQKERDAKICDAVANEHAQWKNDGISADAAEECAAAIRKGSRQLTPWKA